jgi:hypothetical protein
MSRLRWQILGVLLSLLAFLAVPVTAQNLGSLEVAGRVKIGTKTELLKRKRFYLFRGGLEANKTLIDKIKAADAASRDCFYCQTKASPEFINWLKAEDCESPYCRDVTTEDIAKVPEFQAAYQKGMGQFRNKPAVAQKWVTTNLAPNLRDSYYRQRKSLIDSLLAGIKPEQSSMTDSVSVKAIFIDIPLKPGEAAETFLISNLLPIEIGGKGYVWACEVEIGTGKKASLPLKVPGSKKCEVIVKDLPVCVAGTCAQK